MKVKNEAPQAGKIDKSFFTVAKNTLGGSFTSTSIEQQPPKAGAVHVNKSNMMYKMEDALVLKVEQKEYQ